MYLILPAAIFAALYGAVIAFLLWHWRRMPEAPATMPSAPFPQVTVVVPARNEAANIRYLLEDLLAQQYPSASLQIIIVDDHSEDATPEIVLEFAPQGVELLSLQAHLPEGGTQSFKKAAITAALRQARGELIVQTDADCRLGPRWLASLVAFQQQGGYQMVAAPVNFHQEASLFERFQSLAFMGMMGVTGAGIRSGKLRMCNGANLLYARRAFEAVGGHSGQEGRASGDDMFLMHKLAGRFPEGIGFLKSRAATVFTRAKPDWASFFQQRLRWATKNGSYDDYGLMLVNAIVFGTCLLWGVSLLALPFMPLAASLAFGILSLGKGLADALFLGVMSAFFKRRELMRDFLPAFFLHNAYILSVGLAALFQKEYEWKGRRVR